MLVNIDSKCSCVLELLTVKLDLRCFNFLLDVPTVTASTVQSTRVGNSVTIQCVVISNPAALDIVWSKYINNQPTPIDITNNNRLTGGTTSNPSLVINPVEQDDEGNYICQARNEVGTGSSNQVYLDITGGNLDIFVSNLVF